MSLSPWQLRRWQCRLAVLLFSAVLFVGFCPTGANAQMGGIDSDPGDPGTGGKNTIQGSIFLPGGRRLDRRAKVKLVGIGGADQFRLSDDSGAFSFLRLKSGKYTVVVDAGPEFEIASEPVDIIEPARRRGDPGTVQSIYITLQPRKAASTGTVGTVDASAVAVPEAARELYNQAIESAKNGDRKKAIDLLNQALRVGGDFVVALNELGVQYLALRQYEKAITPLRSALGIAPDSFYPRLNYGIALLQTKKYQAAATELQQAIHKDSSSSVAYLHLGRALIQLADYQNAEKSLRRCVDIGGEASIEAHRYLGAAYIELGEAPRAADELESYLKLAPKAGDADRIRTIIRQLRDQKAAKSHG
jgi:predicted Zn-dependent protease